MSRSDGMVAQLVGPNGNKVFVQNISFTTASAGTQLAANTDATVGGNLAIPKGALWVIQPVTADVRYILASAALTVTQTNAVKVLADQQEYVIARETDGSTTPASTTGGTRPYLSLKGESASGSVNVFVVLP